MNHRLRFTPPSGTEPAHVLPGQVDLLELLDPSTETTLDLKELS